MHDMRTIVIDVPGRLSVCQSVCHASSCDFAVQTAIQVLLGLETLGDKCYMEVLHGFDAAFAKLHFIFHLLLL